MWSTSRTGRWGSPTTRTGQSRPSRHLHYRRDHVCRKIDPLSMSETAREASPASLSGLDALTPVQPAEPLAPWFGGKKYLAKVIATRIAAIPHTCYAEPFVGMGGVFLRRSRRPKSEILNDINGEIVNLFRVARDHPDALAAEFDLCIAARDQFIRLIETPPETLTDIRRAARWTYLQRMSFGGKPAHLATPGQMGPSVHHPSRLSGPKMARLIRATHARLQGVHIEQLDWAQFIPRYDRPFTLFYLDPPYWGHETDYGRGVFTRNDFTRLAEMLRGIKGRFILSINDRPQIREMFGWAHIEAVETRYSANARANKRVSELLISGDEKEGRQSGVMHGNWRAQFRSGTQDQTFGAA